MKILIAHRGEHTVTNADIRVVKFVHTLRNAGHSVFVIARGSRNQSPKPSETVEMRCRRPRFLSYPSVFPSPLWSHHISSQVRRLGPDLLIARDLPMAFPAMLAARRFRVPIILDMAENWPAAMKVWNTPRYIKAIDRPDFAHWWEARILPRLDHILVVADEQRERLITQLGIPGHRITIVRNTRDVPTISPSGRSPARTLYYLGAIDAHRGLETAINALPLIRKTIPQVCLRIVGPATACLNELTRLARRLGVEANVTFAEPIPARNVISDLILHETIGIVPQPRNAHTDTTIPNKLFDYLAAARPVLVSDAVALRNLVRKEACGLVFESGSARSFAENALRLLTDPQLAARMGTNGWQAVQREYNWHNDGQRLLRAINQLARGPGHKTQLCFRRGEMTQSPWDGSTVIPYL